MKKKEKIKRTMKDSVFTHLFREPAYLIQLYRIAHPEDSTATEENVLKDFLEKHRQEVINLMFDVFNQEKILEDVLRSTKHEGIEEGEKIGIQIGIEKTEIIMIKSLMQKLNCSFQEAMDFADIPLTDRPRYAKLVQG